MSSVKDALSALCGHVNSLIDVDLTPEHLWYAGRNAANESAAKTLWNTLSILSWHAAREKRRDVDFRDHDALSTIKLHLAFLQYPAIELYSLSQEGKHNTRNALIALTWLLGTQDILNAILRAKLADSILGTECSRVDLSDPSLLTSDWPLAENAELDSILHLNATVNLNLREVNELACERAKLISKVHAASLDVCGLPHLNVSELALTKRLAKAQIHDDGGGESSEEDRRQLREFREVGILLDRCSKWVRKQHTFFDWMTTVIQEHRTSVELNPKVVCTKELAAFNSLLRHIIRNKLRIDASKEIKDGGDSRSVTLNCPSRAHRSQCDSAEAKSWLDDLKEYQNHEEENFQRNKKQLTEELRRMLELMPSVVHV